MCHSSSFSSNIYLYIVLNNNICHSDLQRLYRIIRELKRGDYEIKIEYQSTIIRLYEKYNHDYNEQLVEQLNTLNIGKVKYTS